MTEDEARQRPGTAYMASLAGIPLYVHESLHAHFAAHPLNLSSRGPRVAVLRDPALAALEERLIRDLLLCDCDD
jgi:hypothetical protein